MSPISIIAILLIHRVPKHWPTRSKNEVISTNQREVKPDFSLCEILALSEKAQGSLTRCKKLRQIIVLWGAVFAGCDPNTINVRMLRIPGSRIFILKGPARPRSSLTKYFNPMKREEWWKMIAIVNTTIFNCFDNLIKWSGDQCESHLHIKIFVLRRWNVTDDPGLIDISDAYHLTSFYVILLHNFCSDSSRSGPDDFQETSICFLRHF